VAFKAVNNAAAAAAEYESSRMATVAAAVSIEQISNMNY
jgi:hypothetical protein